MRGPLVGRRLSFSVLGAHFIHSLLHSVSWCKDPANCSSASSSVCEPGDCCIAVAMSPEDGTRLRSPSFHLIPEHTKPPPATTSRVLRGRPTRVRVVSRGALSQLVSVETLVKTERSHATTERGTRSERWPSFLAVTVFSIFAEPALPVLRCQKDGDLRRPFVQDAVALECGNSTERYHNHLTRENHGVTRALTRLRTDEVQYCTLTTILLTASSPKSALTDHLAQASQTATIANAITQTVQQCSIPGPGIFAGPHRYNYARLLCCSAAVSFVLCALHFLRHHPSFQASTSAATQVLTPYTPPGGSVEECKAAARVETSSTSQSIPEAPCSCYWLAYKKGRPPSPISLPSY